MFSGGGVVSIRMAAGMKQGLALPQPAPRVSVDHRVTGEEQPVVSAMNDVLKPYFLLACVAFFVGFVGYLAVGRALTAPAQAADDWQAQISAPAATEPLARLRSI